jgi:mRNA interferase MazF
MKMELVKQTSPTNAYNTSFHSLPVYRGDVYWVDFGEGFDGEQRGIRPALVVQNNVGNLHSPTTVVIPLTTKRKRLPTHVSMSDDFSWDSIHVESTSLCEQIRTISKSRIIRDRNGQYEKIITISEHTMSMIDHAMSIELGIYK